MRGWAKIFTVLGFMLWPMVSPAADLPDIRIFETDSIKAVVPDHWARRVTRYNLDDLARAEHSINATLPADMGKAKAVAAKLISSPPNNLQQGWEALISMAQYHVEYAPAIVFDHGKAVWYGPHLDRAIAAWRLRKAQP